jgi:hypothetical protein
LADIFFSFCLSEFQIYKILVSTGILRSNAGNKVLDSAPDPELALDQEQAPDPEQAPYPEQALNPALASVGPRS